MDSTICTLFFVTYLLINHVSSGNIATDQSALLALKSRMSFGPNNVLEKNWSAESSVCSWVGVSCSSRHHRVVALDISGMSLSASIPSHLGNLSFLRSLNVSDNSFHGNVPEELAQLRRLGSLDFTSNNFTGAFPSFFSSLPSLRILYLDHNEFSGAIPSSISNKSRLEELSLGYNLFQGSIPEGIGDLHFLTYLNLQHNQLTGPIPPTIFNLSSLQALRLVSNNLTGRLPADIGYRLPNLKQLSVCRNGLDGRIPPSLEKCSQLERLSMCNNQLSGTIPREIWNLTMLTRLLLGGNKLLEGQIPAEIGNLQRLQVLDLSLCGLSGSIPQSIFNISSLKTLALLDNSFSGKLPWNLGRGVPNLEEIYFAINNLSGNIPDSIANASKLTILDLQLNMFTGLIPNSLGNLGSLVYLLLNSNYLISDPSTSELRILTSLEKCRHLKSLGLGENPLDRTLPSTIGNLSTSLQSFEAYRSQIRGNIPEEIGNLSQLSVLTLFENELTGSIPPTFRGLKRLEQLSLNGNRIEGAFPIILCSLLNLGLLNLMGNQISGPLPSCIENNTSLRQLYLDSNNLSSALPSSLWKLKDLLSFSASSNLLSGHLPPEIGNLKAITGIDLSRNKFSGNIPDSVDGMHNLIRFFLAYNELEGPIPVSLGKVLSLEILDLSHNKLTGAIPKSFEALLYLKNFNVSFNQLSGEIPSKGPFLNFTNQSFMSNGALCGASRFQVPPCIAFSPHESKRKRSVLILSLVLVIPSLILASVLGFVFIRWQTRKRAAAEDPLPALTRERISYYELEKATNGFSETNLIGVGSYSSVYKGLIGDGTLVAIKVFNLENAGAFKSFDTECHVLRTLRHRNLAKVITSCSNPDFKALVLEYLPNGSLERWLYSHNCFLDIFKRLDILIDVACAVDYLHNGFSVPVVHCDLKPSNVLLDEDMVGHVCDFGIAKLLRMEDGITQTKTLATIGYIAPEYGLHGLVSTKCDVYSFGIMLMETFTRKKPSDDMFVAEVSLCSWIRASIPSEITQVVDSNLLNLEEEYFDAKVQCLLSLMELALECTAESSDARINIEDVFSRLQKIRLQLAKCWGGNMV